MSEFEYHHKDEAKRNAEREAREAGLSTDEMLVSPIPEMRHFAEDLRRGQILREALGLPSLPTPIYRDTFLPSDTPETFNMPLEHEYDIEAVDEQTQIDAFLAIASSHPSLFPEKMWERRPQSEPEPITPRKTLPLRSRNRRNDVPPHRGRPSPVPVNAVNRRAT